MTTEAINFVLSLVTSGLVPPEDIWVSDHGEWWASSI
jgi:hypothetical protein